MNAHTIAAEFLEFARIDSELARLTLATEQATKESDFPRLIFTARWRPMAGSATIGSAEIAISVESRSGDQPTTGTAEEAHASLVNLVRRKFLGSDLPAEQATTRAFVAQLVSARGRVEVDPRFFPLDPQPSIDGNNFRTVVRFRTGVQVRPAI